MGILSLIKKMIKHWFLPQGFINLMLPTQKAPKLIDPSCQKFLEGNKKLKDLYSQNRCFVLGGGSSIKEQDLKKLKGEIVISVSNTFVHPDFHLFAPKYHVVPPIIKSHGHLYEREKFISWLKEMDERTGSAELFFHIGDKQLIDENGLFKNRMIHWVEYSSDNNTKIDPIDLTNMPGIWSVSELAITVAVYLGFDKIYLLGIDHDWFNGPLVYFYDHLKEHKLKPNAESLEYADAEFQMRRHAEMFKKYKELFLIKQNIYNANANPKHYLDVFPKVDYDSLF